MCFRLTWLILLGEKIIDSSDLLLKTISFNKSFSCLMASLIILLSLFRQTLLPVFEEMVTATLIRCVILSEERWLAFNFLSNEIITLPFLNTAAISFSLFNQSKILTSLVNFAVKFLFVANCQFFPSLWASPWQHDSTVLCFHSFPKAMFIFSFRVAWLVCSFHFISPISLKKSTKIPSYAVIIKNIIFIYNCVNIWWLIHKN